MLSRREIETYAGTNVCMTIMQNDTYLSLANAILVFQVDM